MPLRTARRLRRVAWQLPLSIGGLILLVVALFSWSAYREMRVAAVDAAEERLHGASSQIADLLAQSGVQRIAETAEWAGDPLLRVALAADTVDPLVVERLTQFGESSAAIAAVELWDASGTRIAESLADPALRTFEPSGFPAWAAGGPTVSGFRSAGGVVWYDIAAPIRSPDGVAGYVLQSREISTSQASTLLISRLIGTSASFVVGEPGGEWTNLSEPVVAPPWAGTPDAAEYRGPDGRWMVGAGRPIPEMPWVVWVAFPREEVLSGAVGFAMRLAGMGLLLVGAGGLGGLGLSRRITGPLGRLHGAAAAISDGDLGRRVVPEGAEELRELGEAFNAMAGRVEGSHHRLEELVEERTAALRSSIEQFDALATSAHDAIITGDASGRITYFNPGAERIFGYTADEVVGQEIAVLVSDRLREAHRAGFARFLKTREPRMMGHTAELEGRRRNGEEFPVELSLASWERDGEPRFAGILRDVTARKAAEAVARKYAADLEAANHELEAFSYSVSHDLRAPLRAIHGFSQALLEDQADRLDETGLDHLGRVCAAADRMAALIDDLLELARVARKEMRDEAVDLAPLALRVIADLQRENPERVVDLRIAEPLPVRGDPSLLGLVLQNLLGNAWKFTSRRPDATIEVGLTDTPERAVFVRDDGAGFDMEYADKLFGVFQRLHSPTEFPGTGVGLAIVQRIVHRHGGRAWAEAAPDQGATFYFTLPEAE